VHSAANQLLLCVRVMDTAFEGGKYEGGKYDRRT